MRRKLEASRPRHHLKRGFGGVADIEFIVQYLQLVHAAQQPELLRPNLWDALDALRRHGIIDARDPRRAARRLRLPPRRRGPAPAHPESQRRRAARRPPSSWSGWRAGSTMSRPIAAARWRRSSPIWTPRPAAPEITSIGSSRPRPSETRDRRKTPALPTRVASLLDRGVGVPASAGLLRLKAVLQPFVRRLTVH